MVATATDGIIVFVSDERHAQNFVTALYFGFDTSHEDAVYSMACIYLQISIS